MPIAFQWIEEHKNEVYAHVEDHLKDDVGVVIAAAFQLIKGLGAYQKGLVKYEEYERAVKDGTWDPTISTRSGPQLPRMFATQRARFRYHKDVLKDTIR